MSKSVAWALVCTAAAAGVAFAQQASSTWPSPSRTGSMPADELISIRMTRPIPMRKAPPGCAVSHAERYCRSDKRPLRSFKILEQRISEPSRVSVVKIDKGCLVVNMTLAVPPAATPGDMCLGGEPTVELRIEVSTKAH